MKIETKFDIGQTVYIISGGEIKKKKIDTISLYLDNEVTYEFDDFNMVYMEHELFATKKEALNKLRGD